MKDELHERARLERKRQRSNPDRCQAMKGYSDIWPCGRRARVIFKGKGYCVGHYRSRVLPIKTLLIRYPLIDGDALLKRAKK